MLLWLLGSSPANNIEFHAFSNVTAVNALNVRLKKNLKVVIYGANARLIRKK
jgi:hypothetical protein